MLTGKKGRIFLSHKVDFEDHTYPLLTQEEFAQVFIEGFIKYSQITCTLINYSSWIVKISYPQNKFSPQDLGKMCAQALAKKRLSEKPVDYQIPDIIVLGEMQNISFLKDSNIWENDDWFLTIIETKNGEKLMKNIANNYEHRQTFKIALIHN
jgi:hypothetical protein